MPGSTDTPPHSRGGSNSSLSFFSTSRPLSSHSTHNAPPPRSASRNSLQPTEAVPGGLSGAALLSAPPSPARVRGQRASNSTAPYGGVRAPSPNARGVGRSPSKEAQDREEREREATLRLPGEEVDDFGLPIRTVRRSYHVEESPIEEEKGGNKEEGDPKGDEGERGKQEEDNFRAVTREVPREVNVQQPTPREGQMHDEDGDSDSAFESAEETPEDLQKPKEDIPRSNGGAETATEQKEITQESNTKDAERPSTPKFTLQDAADRPRPVEETPEPVRRAKNDRRAQMFDRSLHRDEVGGVSAVSHQAMAIQAAKEKEAPPKTPEDEWQQMRAYGKFDVYDDEGRVMAKGMESDEDEDVLSGGARKGYTKLTFDDDAASQNSMDEDTKYLFGEQNRNLLEDDEEARDPLQQMQATKDMLTEGQRIAYVGLTRLSIATMVKDLDNPKVGKKLKKDYTTAMDAMKMWGQKMMVRLYAHMEIESTEQIMIEQLTEHGVQPSDLTPLLMQNARVRNPMASTEAVAEKDKTKSPSKAESQRPSIAESNRPSMAESRNSTEKVPRESTDETVDSPPIYAKLADKPALNEESDAPPAYEDQKGEELTVQSPGMLPTTKNIDIDLRWTVLCDLFLVLIADSIYDSRSRMLLEQVGGSMEVSWMDICRFEKRVTDALEMEEEANRENWDEKDNVEARRKLQLKRRYVIMGLATVGGGLVIGLSAGLLAPVIGSGLGAGFAAIGVTGTTSFMVGAGGAAIITSASATAGGVIAVRASNRRTGAVKTFEYRPLHNNKRVNLIVTVSGWMNGKVDDVRLPFSTVDPVMGDIYSLLWEPDVLRSTGDTLRILATEALTQGLQQVLAATFLTTLMAGLSLPIVLSKLSYLIDNPWSVSLDRADSAGLILADSLVQRNLGVRPITLVGFSLGARVIFSALRELANRGAYGLIHNVYLFGSPVTASKDDYLRARTVISGRFVNGYATNDWIIGYLFRATSGGLSRVAGLAKIDDVPGLENLDVTDIVNGHMAYRAAMPKLLRKVGWEVESDEFAEIEDPDPENHEARQRELIKEIDSARHEAEKAPEPKGRWANFWTKKKDKKGWERYDANSVYAWEKKKEDKDKDKDDDVNVLFDIDAIRRELDSEQIEVRQLESTLPPMRLDMGSSASTPNDADGTSPASRGASPAAKGASPGIGSGGGGSGGGGRFGPWTWAKPMRLPRAGSISKVPTSPPVGGARASWDYDEGADAEGDAKGDVTMSFEKPKTPAWAGPREPEEDGIPARSASRSPAVGASGTNGWGRTDDEVKGWEKDDRDVKMQTGWGESEEPAHREPEAKPRRGVDAEARAGRSPSPAGLAIDHNAWANDEDAHGAAGGKKVEEHGEREAGMQMTFE